MGEEWEVLDPEWVSHCGLLQVWWDDGHGPCWWVPVWHLDDGLEILEWEPVHPYGTSMEDWAYLQFYKHVFSDPPNQCFKALHRHKEIYGDESRIRDFEDDEMAIMGDGDVR